jgi:GntR family transcriptional regulator of arabinose operon
MTQSSFKADMVRQTIVEWISSGRFREGEQMPSEQVLAQELGVSLQTVRRGLAQLASEGLIFKQPRVGNFVRRSPGKRTTSQQMAVVFPSYDGNNSVQMPANTLLLQGIQEALDNSDFDFTTIYYQRDQFSQIVDGILKRDICGVLLQGLTSVPASEVQRLLNEGVQVALLSNHPHLMACGISSFYHNQDRALGQILNGLIERGHRRIAVACLTHPPFNPHREAALYEFASRMGIEDPRSICIPLPNARHGVDYSHLHELLASPSRPTALVVPDECVASVVFRFCYQHDINIPNDLSLAACHDNTPRLHPVPLTAPDTVMWIVDQGRAAAEHMIRLVKHGAAPTLDMGFYGQLCWRESVANLKPVKAAEHDRLLPTLRPSAASQP